MKQQRLFRYRGGKKMKAALTACSDPLPLQWQEEIEQLKAWLKQEGHEVVASPYLFGYSESHSNEGYSN